MRTLHQIKEFSFINWIHFHLCNLFRLMRPNITYLQWNMIWLKQNINFRIKVHLKIKHPHNTFGFDSINYMHENEQINGKQRNHQLAYRCLQKNSHVAFYQILLLLLFWFLCEKIQKEICVLWMQEMCMRFIFSFIVRNYYWHWHCWLLLFLLLCFSFSVTLSILL